MKPRNAILALILLWSFGLSGQDISGLRDQPPVQLSGSLSVGLNAYATNRERPRYDPFSYTLAANPVLRIYGVSLPMSFVYSERERSFRQPFNRFGLRPTYKWARMHLGYSNVYFSNYSLAGRTFLGGGLELNPGKLRFGAVYGRFNRGIEVPADAEVYLEPTFDRWGYAFKLGVGANTNYLDLVFFKGEDRYDEPRADSLRRSANPPAENVIIGLKTSQLFFQRLTFDLDLAASAWSSNLLSAEVAPGEFAGRQVLEQLITPRYATRLSLAGEAGLGVRFSHWGLRLQYRRIDPEYQSMGAFTYQTDIEDLTVQPSLNLMKGRLFLSGSVGLQRNNIYENRLQQTSRRIGSANAQFTPGRVFAMNLSYSNFRVDVQAVSEEFLSDSFNIVQVNEQLNMSTNLNLGDQDIRKQLSFSAYGSRFNDLSETVSFAQENQMFGGRLGWRQRWQTSGLSFSAHVSGARFSAAEVASDRYGGGLSLGKDIGEHLELEGRFSYRLNRRLGQDDGGTLSARTSLRYRLEGGHSFRFNASWMQRSYGVSSRAGFSEFRAWLRYTFSF
ncbi:MAG: hypothetical protein KDC54_04085 [Lewinella sp.]|nr:hypothetical protein [Lewinella sp.]